MLLNCTLRLSHVHKILHTSPVTETSLMMPCPSSIISMFNESSLESEDIRALCSLHKQGDLVIWLVLLIDPDRPLTLDNRVALFIFLILIMRIRSSLTFHTSLSLGLGSDSFGLLVEGRCHTLLSPVVFRAVVFFWIRYRCCWIKHVLIPTLLVVPVPQVLL